MAISDPSPLPSDPTGTTCTVTFGRSSFVGRSLAAALAASGHWATIRVLDPLQPEPLSHSSSSSPLTHLVTDFSDPAQVLAAVSGATAVFHVDPTTSSVVQKGEFWGLHEVAVGGTRRVLEACGKSGVSRVVYTGSADVVFDGVTNLVDADEDAPYPDKFDSVLNELRAQVEMMVLTADKKAGMRTCALRASNAFGPGDSNLQLFISGYAKSWFSKFKFVRGSGNIMCDFTYVENIAHANICAEQALCSNATFVAGKPYFVTNGEPIETWEFISAVVEGLGYQRPTICVPVKIVLLSALLAKLIHEKLGLQKAFSPFLDPSIIYSLSCTRTFNSAKAKRVLEYSPVLSLEEGLMRTVNSLPEVTNNLELSRRRDFRGPSKAEILLGSGVAADILLWRDEKRTFTVVTILFMLFYWFLLSNRTFIESVARILLVISMALFFHGNAPSSLFGLTIEKITPVYFEVSQSTMRNSFMSLASVWNKGIHILKLLAKGDDSDILFKVVASLCFLKLMFCFPLTILIGIGLACIFIVFIVYEQCEEEVDRLLTTASIKIKVLAKRILAKLPPSLKTYISYS